MFNKNRCFDGMNLDKMYPEQAIPNEQNISCQNRPIFEPMQERICHKEFIHEVPHVCPINTRIINHHIYRHTYTPCYTCCEENEICNIYDGCSTKF